MTDITSGHQNTREKEWCDQSVIEPIWCETFVSVCNFVILLSPLKPQPEILNKKGEHGLLSMWPVWMNAVIFLDDWRNFKEREHCTEANVWDRDKTSIAVRHWASYRAQTLTRTGLQLLKVRWCTSVTFIDATLEHWWCESGC